MSNENKTPSCGQSLAKGQWWNYCGERDHGDCDPALCTHCGGSLIRADDVNHPDVMKLLLLFRRDSLNLRKEKYPDEHGKWFPEAMPTRHP